MQLYFQVHVRILCTKISQDWDRAICKSVKLEIKFLAILTDVLKIFYERKENCLFSNLTFNKLFCFLI